MRQYHGLHARSRQKADFIPRHHEGGGHGPASRRHAFHEKRRRGRPFSAEADTEHELHDDHHLKARRQPRQAGKDSEPDHADHEGEPSPVAIGQPSPTGIADGAAEALHQNDSPHGA